MKALTIRQPWAHAISHGPKRIENRTWSTDYRGWLAIHAGMPDVVPAAEFPMALPKSPPTRRIVAIAQLLCVVDERWSAKRVDAVLDDAPESVLDAIDALDDDPWAVGPVYWFLGDVVALPEHPALIMPGQRRLWEVPASALAVLNASLMALSPPP